MKIGVTGTFESDKEGFKPSSAQIRALHDNLTSNYDFKVFDWNDVVDNVSSKFYSEGPRNEDLHLDSLDILVVRQLGNISSKKDAFLSFLNNLSEVSAKVVNNPDKMINNLDKSYLIDLFNKGFDVVPTYLVKDPVDTFYKVRVDFGVKEVVFKPKYFGESGIDVYKFGEAPSLSFNNQDYIAQPFMQDIYEGEHSLFFFGDDFSHGILKSNSSTNFKINYSENSVYSRFYPDENLLRKSQELIEYMGDEDQILRLDFVNSKSGYLLMEYEAINPSPYMESVDVKKLFCDNFNQFLKDKYLL